MKNIFRAVRHLMHYWPLVAGALISLLLVNAANLMAPQILRLLIDRGISALDMRQVYLSAGALVAVTLFGGIFNFLQGYWSEAASQGAAYELRNAIFAKLQNLSFSYHDRANTGKLMTRMTSDVELVRQFVGSGLIQLLSGLFLLIGSVIVLYSMNALLATIVVVVVPSVLFVLFLMIRQIMPLSGAIQKKLGALNTTLQENLAGIRVVKAFARERYEQERFEQQNRALLGENISMLRAFTTFFPLVFFIANLSVVGVVWAGGLEVIDGRLTLGELVAFTGYIGFLLMPVFMLGMIGAMFSRAAVSAERIFEVVDAEAEVHSRPGAMALPPIRGRVEFENVSFRYAGSDQYVLEQVSFRAEPGQKVALLGETGSGKSTIINLIPRFYDVSEGRVLIDGYDVRDVTLDSLRSQVGIVLQETVLFSGTIRENIAYGRPDASIEEIRAAARAAQADEFIEKLPQGYDSLVGERGVGLSGGQKQRIAIARALLVDPRILILDDSTSAVDAETEYRIQLALQRLMEGRTSFVIAQRISTVRDADLILLLQNGRLVAQGRHADLLQTSELYAEILATQFAGQREEPLPAGPVIPEGQEVQR